MFETGSIGGDAAGLRAVPAEALLTRLEATPAGLDALPILVELGERTLDADGWLTVTEHWAKQDAWQAAQRHAATAHFAGPEARSPGRMGKCHDAAAYEYAPAHRVCVETAAARMFHARQLAGPRRPLRDALAAGVFTEAQVCWLVDRLGPLSAEAAARVQAALIDAATAGRGLATGALRRRAGRLIDAADPTDATRRAEQSRTERRVELGPVADGMAWLSAWLPAEAAAACWAQLNKLAHRVPAAGGGPISNLDARRADALTDAILGNDTSGAAATPPVDVQVTIDLATLLHLRDHPGEILGFGTLPADIARDLAADATWRRFVYDPVDGHLLDYGSTRYTPPPRLAAYVKARDGGCLFPSSTRRATHADLDHAVPFADGGPTSAANLTTLARGPHRQKTFGGWQTKRDPDTATVTWTSPLGRTYTVHPLDYRPEVVNPPPPPAPPPEPLGDPPF